VFVLIARKYETAFWIAAMDCLYERDCQLFPELLEAAIKDDDNVSSPDHNGQGTEFHAVRQVWQLLQ
jgi:hypothetical protein